MYATPGWSVGTVCAAFKTTATELTVTFQFVFTISPRADGDEN